MEFGALKKWTKLNGVGTAQVFIDLADIVLVESLQTVGADHTLLISRHGVKVTVAHSAEDIVKLIEVNDKATLEHNLEFWKERDQIRSEIRKLKAQDILKKFPPTDTSTT